MARLFISHSSVDSAAALSIRGWLAVNGWDDVFLDVDPDRGIHPGARWQDALRHAQSRCEAVLLLLTPAWVDSDWCRTEFLLASQLNKRIVAALIEPVPFDRLPSTLTAEWQVVDLTHPARDEALPSGTHSYSSEGLRRLRHGLTAAGIDATHFPWPVPGAPASPPYPGLRALDETDAGIFFGRDGQVILALDQIRGLRERQGAGMFAILGASGAGKSSFLRAGLLPRLCRDDRHYRVMPTVRPGRAALGGDTGLVASLVAALSAAGQGTSRSEVERLLSEEPSAPFRALSRPGTPAPVLVLPVDQAEESLDHAEGTDLLRVLSRVSAEEGMRLLVILAVRSDRWDQLQSRPELGEVRQTLFSLPPMPPGAYGDVIRGPARRMTDAGSRLEVEEPLVDRLLQDIAEGGARDSLPLLAFTLQGLWREEGATGRLTLARYLGMGGLRGSIEAAVGRALRRAEDDRRIPLDPQARLALLRRGFIPWLAGIDSETGTPRRRVARLSEIPEEARPMMEILVEERLLTQDRDSATGETVLEPAHEALLRQWALVGNWLGEDLQDFTTIEGIRRAARDWAANARDPDWIAHSDARLSVARQAADRPDFAALLEPTDRAYLHACLAAAEAEARRRRQRRLVRAGLAGGAFVAVSLAAVAFWGLWTDAEQARRENAAALAMIAARDLGSGGKPEEAVAAAHAAFAILDTEDTRSALLAALLAVPDSLLGVRTLDGPVPTALAFLPDGRLLAAARDGTALILSDDRTPVAVDLAPERPPADGSRPRLVSVSRTTSGAVALFGDGAAQAISLDGEATPRADGGAFALSGAEGSLAMASSGDRFAFLDGGRVILRICETIPCVDHEVPATDISALALSPDGAVLALSGPAGLRVLEADSGRVLVEGKGSGVPAFGPDGDTLIVREEAGRLRLLNGLRSGSPRETLIPAALRAEDGMRQLSLSGDGLHLAAACGDGVTCVLPLGSGGGMPVRLSGGRAMTVATAWAPDGRLATLDIAGTLRFWRPAPPPATGLGEVRHIQRDAESDSLLLRTDRGLARLGQSGKVEMLAEVGSATPGLPLPEEALPGRVLDALFDGRPEEGQDWTGVSGLLHAAGKTVIAYPYQQVRVAVLGPFGLRLSAPLPSSPSGVAIDGQGDRLFVATRDGAVRRVRLADGVEEQPLLPPAPPPAIGASSVSLSPDGSLLAASLGDTHLAVRSTRDGSEVYSLPLHYPDTKIVAFAPTGLRLAILASNGDLDLWDLSADPPERRFSVPLAQDNWRPGALGWLDGTTLAVSFPDDGLRLIPTEPADWLARVARLKLSEQQPEGESR